MPQQLNLRKNKHTMPPRRTEPVEKVITEEVVEEELKEESKEEPETKTVKEAGKPLSSKVPPKK